MSDVEEYVGCRSIEVANFDEQGHNLYNIWLNIEEPIVRCRDCLYCFAENYCRLLEKSVQTYGFCAWGVRRND